MGSNEDRAWVSLGGVGNVELSEGFFGLTELFLLYLNTQICEIVLTSGLFLCCE